ncbi:hypothetical protein [Natronococcus wangiae]|nr:hypothetical protein [Natronococcus sp. AD5]
MADADANGAADGPHAFQLSCRFIGNVHSRTSFPDSVLEDIPI